MKISTAFADSVIPTIIYDMKFARSVFICAASISKEALERIDVDIPEKCEKILVSGMFYTEPAQVEACQTALRLGWKVGVIPNLHAKVYAITHRNDSVIIYIGSSNLTRMGNSLDQLEMNVRLSAPKMPAAVKSFIRRCKSEMKSIKNITPSTVEWAKVNETFGEWASNKRS